MHHGIVFPEGVRVTDALEGTTEVTTWSDQEVLARSADSHRLRCPGCLGRLIPERHPAVHGPINHFRHHPGADADCPFRVNWKWTDRDDEPPSSSRGEDPGKLVERLLLRALQRNLSDRPGAGIASRDLRLPELRIDGLKVPAEILSLAPGDEPRWSLPFEGFREERATLFFVAGWDLKRLDSGLAEELLPRRPWIAVWPARPGKPKDRFGFVGSDPRGDLEQLPIGEIDLTWVDYGELFGMERAGDLIFIRKKHRRALDDLGEEIVGKTEGSPVATLLRLVAKVVLVEGAAVERSVFGQDRAAALRPFGPCGTFPQTAQLLDYSVFWKSVGEVRRGKLVERQPLVKTCLERFVLGYLQDLWDRAQESDQAKAKIDDLERELRAKRKAAAALSKKLEAAQSELESRATELASAETRRVALDGARRGLEADKKRLEQELGRLQVEAESIGEDARELRQMLQSVWRHWLGRKALEHYLNERELRSQVFT